MVVCAPNRTMTLKNFQQLYRAADSIREPVTVAVMGAADPTVLACLRTACDRRWVAPVLVGSEHEIRSLAESLTLSLDRCRIVDTNQPAATAVAEVRAGRAQLLMKGQISTPDLMKSVLDPQHGLRTDRTISQVVLVELSQSGRLLLLTDTGICIQPTLSQKVDILRSVVEVAWDLGEPKPRVALMAATESPSNSMPETQEAAAIQRMAEQGDFPNCFVQGPLSFDLAFTTEAGSKKGIAGPVAGAADVMVFPNLVSANLTVKAIMYTADCQFGGVLCGAACPIVFMSRSDTTATRLNSLALALQILHSGTSR